MKEEAIRRIVSRLVREGVIPDTSEARALAESTVEVVTRRRVVYMVSKMMERWLQTPEDAELGVA